MVSPRVTILIFVPVTVTSPSIFDSGRISMRRTSMSPSRLYFTSKGLYCVLKPRHDTRSRYLPFSLTGSSNIPKWFSRNVSAGSGWKVAITLLSAAAISTMEASGIGWLVKASTTRPVTTRFSPRCAEAWVAGHRKASVNSNRLYS